jgi:hypothetical protein
MKRITLALAAFALFATSCGPKIYKSEEFESVTTKHKIVAILPADVNIKLRPVEAKKLTPEDMLKNEETTGLSIQDKMYSWFLRRSESYHYTVKFQDISKTNALLKTANISYADLRTKSKDDIAKILGVDAVISSTVRMDKPMSEGAAVAVGLLVGSWGNTNNAFTTINIHEAKQGELIWKYDYQASGSVGSSPDNLVNALMRNASKKFPYNSRG